MTVAEAVNTTLRSDVAVAAIVGTRIYNLVARQNTALPAVRFQVTGEDRVHHLRGKEGLQTTEVQVDSVGADTAGHSAVEALADAVDAAMEGLRGNITGSPQSMHVSGVFRYLRTDDFLAAERNEIRIIQRYRVHNRRMTT